MGDTGMKSKKWCRPHIEGMQLLDLLEEHGIDTHGKLSILDIRRHISAIDWRFGADLEASDDTWFKRARAAQEMRTAKNHHMAPWYMEVNKMILRAIGRKQEQHQQVAKAVRISTGKLSRCLHMGIIWDDDELSRILAYLEIKAPANVTVQYQKPSVRTNTVESADSYEVAAPVVDTEMPVLRPCKLEDRAPLQLELPDGSKLIVPVQEKKVITNAQDIINAIVNNHFSLVFQKQDDDNEIAQFKIMVAHLKSKIAHLEERLLDRDRRLVQVSKLINGDVADVQLHLVK